MKILNHKFFDVIKIDCENPETIVIENPVLFRNTVDELLTQIGNDEGDFVLSDESSKIVPLSKNVMLVTDIYNLDSNSKQIKTKLLNTIMANYSDVENKEQLMVMINDVGIKITNELPYMVSFKPDIAFSDVIKFLDFTLDFSTLTFLEAFVESISTSFELLKFKLLIIVNLKESVAKDELDDITKIFRYKRIPLLMLERHQHAELDDIRHTRIIDNDLCVI